MQDLTKAPSVSAHPHPAGFPSDLPILIIPKSHVLADSSHNSCAHVYMHMCISHSLSLCPPLSSLSLSLPLSLSLLSLSLSRHVYLYVRMYMQHAYRSYFRLILNAHMKYIGICRAWLWKGIFPEIKGLTTFICCPVHAQTHWCPIAHTRHTNILVHMYVRTRKHKYSYIQKHINNFSM